MFMPSLWCLCLRPWFSWVGGFRCTSSPYLFHPRYECLMHGGGAEMRSYQHSRLARYTRSRARLSTACRALLLCGQAASPGLSCLGRQAAPCPRMNQSGGRQLLLLVPLWMTQSGASGSFLHRFSPSCRASAIPSCFAPEDPVLGTSWPRLRLAALPRPCPGLRITASPRAPPLGCRTASPWPCSRGCCSPSPRPPPLVYPTASLVDPVRGAAALAA